jgi:hypothetical protein
VEQGGEREQGEKEKERDIKNSMSNFIDTVRRII